MQLNDRSLETCIPLSIHHGKLVTVPSLCSVYAVIIFEYLQPIKYVNVIFCD